MLNMDQIISHSSNPIVNSIHLHLHICTSRLSHTLDGRYLYLYLTENEMKADVKGHKRNSI